LESILEFLAWFSAKSTTCCTLLMMFSDLVATSLIVSRIAAMSGKGKPTISWTTLRMPEVTLRAVPRLRMTSLCFKSSISCAVASTGGW